MKKRILIIGLSLVMTATALTGCGGKNAGENNEETAASQNNEDTSDNESEEQDDKNGSDVEEDFEANAPAGTHDADSQDEDNENKAEEEPVVTQEELLLASIIGNWQSEYTVGDRRATASLVIRPSGEYELKLVYDGNGWTHGEYYGNVVIENFGNNLVASFKLDKSSDGNFSAADTIGDFFIDAIRENDYGTNLLYLTQANNGDSIFSMYFDEMRPVMYAFNDPYEGEDGAKYFEVKSPSEEYYYTGSEKAEKTFELSVESVVSNDITDDDVWFNSIGAVQPDYYWMDENYIYCKSNVRNYEYTQLDVFDNTSDDGEGELLYSFNMMDFHTAGGFTEESAYANFVSQGIRYALIKDGVLYIATGHRTYAESCPATGYITAIDIETGEVIWKTEQRVCNTSSFAFVENGIVCGYGFTAEPDYLNVIDMKTGVLLSQYDVKNAVDYVVYKDGKLYVRTYSYNYVYNVNMNN